MMPRLLMEVDKLRKYFPVYKGVFRKQVGNVKAVDDISFNIFQGETLGLVGESGCGKTTAGRTIVRLLQPTGGDVRFHDGDRVVSIPKLDRRGLWSVRSKIQMVFQDPHGSLNARMTVQEIVGEPLVCYGIGSHQEQRQRVAELLQVVGLDPNLAAQYPHAFSGGQRQRIGIARALALNPTLIILDESVSSLDVSIQAQILNLMQDLQEQFNLTYLFIAHDLGVVEHISNRVAVMYVGKLMELTGTEALFHHPKHPYVEALLSAVPRPNPHYRLDRMVLPGEVADPSNRPQGCAFHPRCKYACDICRQEEPALTDVAGKEASAHWVACHLASQLSLKGVMGRLA